VFSMCLFGYGWNVESLLSDNSDRSFAIMVFLWDALVLLLNKAPSSKYTKSNNFLMCI
jgi:hypothetical protein